MQHIEQRIIDLTLQGLSGRKVAERLGIEERTVQIVARYRIGKTASGNRSADNQLGNLKPYIDECLQRQGLNPRFCYVCHEWQRVDCDIHHLKYENATIDDLTYACRSCNLSRINKGLL